LLALERESVRRIGKRSSNGVTQTRSNRPQARGKRLVDDCRSALALAAGGCIEQLLEFGFQAH
jgi:hypothetical protein